MDKVTLTVQIPKDVHRKAKTKAALVDASMAKIMRDALVQFVQDFELPEDPGGQQLLKTGNQ